MKKKKFIGVMTLCLLALFLFWGNSESMEACSARPYNYNCGSGCTAYGHSWETPSTCSTCGGDHVISSSSTCSKCSGKGYTQTLYATGACSYNSSCKVYQRVGCSNCGGSSSYYYHTCGYTYSNSYKSGTGKVTSSSSCSKCYASGTYKGKNTRCTTCKNKGTGAYYYAAWSDYPNGTCYWACPGTHVAYYGCVHGRYTADASYHYSICSYCGGTISSGGHSFGSEYVSNGYKYQNCTTCGYVKNNGPNSYYLDLNGLLDGTYGSGISGYGTADVYVNGTQVANDVTDYYALHPYGSTYEIKDIKSTTGHKYNGVASGSISGTIGASACAVQLSFSTCTYTVTSNPNNGDTAWNTVVTYGSAYGTSVVPNMIRTGYNFLGWYKQLNPKTWNDGYGGTAVNQTGTMTSTLSSDGTYTNYKWTGFNTSSDTWNWLRFSSYSVDAGATVTISGYIRINSSPVNLQLYHSRYANDYTTGNMWGKSSTSGEWEYFELTRTFEEATDTAMFEVVTGNLNGQTGTIDFDLKNISITQKSGTGDKITSSTIVSTASAHIVTAAWEKIPYTITYNANGGSFTDGTTETKSVTAYYEDTVPLDVACEKDGYVFLGWAASSDAKRCLSNMTMPAGNVNLYAIYSLPVSDMKEAVLVAWNKNDVSTYKAYPMDLIGQDVNDYHYSLEGLNITQGLEYSSKSDIRWKVVLYDNAGNFSELYGPDVEDEPQPTTKAMYLQTVMHYVWNTDAGEYVYYTTTDELVTEGETFTPSYISDSSEKYPTGYTPSKIDETYVVTEAKTSYAYYMPKEYTLYFDANGGVCDTKSKSVTYNDFYGELPTATRTGYDFLGWFTDAKEGTQVSSTDRYTVNGNSTVYAQWSARKHSVVYDYWTNGGTSSTVTEDEVAYGSEADLTVTAAKSGWTFVGWNTDPDATEGLISYTMMDEDVTLYAIYSKIITCIFYSYENTTRVTEYIKDTIYNNETAIIIMVPELHDSNMFDEKRGWSISSLADAEITASPGSELSVSANTIFYGCYVDYITVTYDTNGSSQEIAEVTGEYYQSASGKYIFPTFVTAEAPELPGSSFVSWKAFYNDEKFPSIYGNSAGTYEPNKSVSFYYDMLLAAQWDRYPEIEAYDRYFTLDEAFNGDITTEELLEKVVATDNEDGTLENGTDVIVKGYNSSIFTEVSGDTEVEVTYQATDSYGNVVEKTITIHIVDTTAKVSNHVKYIRFISKEYYMDDTGLIPAAKGGLEETSIWRTDESYARLLNATLSNEKSDVKTVTLDSFSMNKEVTLAGSGKWESSEETWFFTKDELTEIREFTSENGYGNAIELFRELFFTNNKNSGNS